MAQKNNIKGKRAFNISWLYAIIIGVLAFYFFFGEDKSNLIKEVNYTELKGYIEKGYINNVIVNSNNNIEAQVKPDSVKGVWGKDASVNKGNTPTIFSRLGSTEKFEEYINDIPKEKRPTLEYKEEEGFWGDLLVTILPILLIVAFWMFIMRRMSGGGGGGGQGNVFSIGKSQAKLFEGGNGSNITFKDVAGLDEAKQEVQEIVDFLKNPQKYTDLGGKIPKGALLIGPPGTGKTLIAKAMSGEAGVPFFSLSGSDFMEMFVGVGASRVRDLFRQAKEKSPCIIFIDEIDAIGRARDKVQRESHDERENTLNRLLTEMDGFETNSGIIVLAATNRVEILDKALLRAGRFDRQIHVDLPNLQERKEIFAVHFRPVKLDESVDIDFLARQTPGFSGADIANVCNEAALIAARSNKKTVDKDDFLAAIDRIIGGLEKKSRVLTHKEKKAIAIHEAGHATASWFLEHANPLVKVTIVPRGRALGAAWYLPEERQITTKEQLLDQMCSTLGGRAAEELFLGRISTGAMDDLERVTKQAYQMVVYAGMSEELQNVNYNNTSEFSIHRPYSEKTAELIDNEVKKMIAEQYERAKSILLMHKEGHSKLANQLLENEVIFAENVEEIFGKRKWASRSDEILAEEQKGEATEIDSTTAPSSEA